MRFWNPALGLSNRRRSVALFALLSPFLSSTFVRAQDAAEAARQERAAGRKEVPHVYTEEDLKRKKILTPEDQARVEARKKQPSPTPGQQNAESQPADPSQQTESLGGIARRYRREKEAREAEQAAKKNLTPFPYEVPNQPLASPKPDVGPSTGGPSSLDLRERPSLSPLPLPGMAPRAKSPRERVSPFQPRPLVASPPPANTAPVNPPVLAPFEYAIPSVGPAPAGRAGLRPLEVRRGDSWWKLANRYMGSGTRWQQLRGLNPEVKGPPEWLRPGSIIQVPETPNLSTEKPQKRIVIRKGDTLWVLARVHLGRGSAWSCLASANPQIKNYTQLAIGSVLLLPARDASPLCQTPTGDRLQP